MNTELENISITQHATNNGCLRRRVVDCSQFNKVLKKCFLHPSLDQNFLIFNSTKIEFFKGLKHIHIDGQATEIELSTLCSLLVFTQNHDFESISITGPTVQENKHQTEKVTQALVQSFTSPISATCTLISLTDIAQLPFSFLFWLVKKFLYSPSTVPQKMVISSCHIDYTAIPSGKELNSIPKPPNLDNSCKSLQLSKLVLSPSPSPSPSPSLS